MEDRELIRIKLHRCLLALTELELQTLLKGRPDIWERGLRRGKGILRAEKNAERQAKPRQTREVAPD